MVTLQHLLRTNDELNLYLTANKLKPSSIIHLCTLDIRDEDYIKREEELTEKNKIDKILSFLLKKNIVKLKQEHIEDLEKELEKLKVPYKELSRIIVQKRRHTKEGKPYLVNHEIGEFVIGQDISKLELAMKAGDPIGKGLALGYPEESVNSFRRIINNEIRNGIYLEVQLSKAKKAGINIPTWLAYISFIPDTIDLLNNKVSKTAEEKGKTYMDFVRTNNPDLAIRIEIEFLNRRLINSWKINKKGEYLEANYDPQNKITIG